jgi:hypothetical protein
MTQEHPITPSQKLVDKWVAMLEYCEDIDVFTDIARWGADTELEACCEWLNYEDRGFWGCKLRTARRPKPPSLKEEALKVLSMPSPLVLMTPESFTKTLKLKQALESLPD